MNAKEFIRAYAEHYDITVKDATSICESVFAFLKKTLYEDKIDISIHKFGTFKHKKTAEKKVKHPGTGEITTIPERTIIKFTQSVTCDIND